MKICSAALLAAIAVPVSAQQAQPLVVQTAQPAAVLRAGTPVVLKTLVEMTTKGKHLKVGDRFNLEVAEPVTLNDQVVIPAGSNAVGEITSIRNKGMWGKSGNIETRMLYLVANDRRVRLSGSVGDKGVKAGGGAIATSAVVFLPAGFFMTGTSAVIPPGTRVNAMLDEDLPVVFASATSPVQAMAVATRAPTAAPASTPVAGAKGVVATDAGKRSE